MIILLIRLENELWTSWFQIFGELRGERIDKKFHVSHRLSVLSLQLLLSKLRWCQWVTLAGLERGQECDKIDSGWPFFQSCRGFKALRPIARQRNEIALKSIAQPLTATCHYSEVPPPDLCPQRFATMGKGPIMSQERMLSIRRVSSPNFWWVQILQQWNQYSL